MSPSKFGAPTRVLITGGSRASSGSRPDLAAPATLWLPHNRKVRSRRSTRHAHRASRVMLPTQTPLLSSSPKSAANVKSRRHNPLPRRTRPGRQFLATRPEKFAHTPRQFRRPLSSSQKPSFKRGSTPHQKLRPRGKIVLFAGGGGRLRLSAISSLRHSKPRLSACAKQCPWNWTPPKSHRR